MRLADLPDDETLLSTYADKLGEDTYVLGAVTDSRNNILNGIKISLALDGRPTMVLTSDAMLRLIERIEALEDRASLSA